MSVQDTLTLSFLGGLFNARTAYLLGYSWLFGMSLWVTFFGGVIAHRVLTKQQFGAFSQQTFPVYFTVSLGISSTLLAFWVYHHPNVLDQLDNPLVVDVAQAYALASVICLQGVNHFVFGPMTTRTMLRLQQLHQPSEVDHSKEIDTLKATFVKLHGISSLTNLSAFIALTFHGLCLGAYI